MTRDDRSLLRWKAGWPLSMISLLVIIELVRRFAFPEFFDSWSGLLLLVVLWGIVLAGGAHIVMGAMADSNQLLLRQNRELLALHHASLEIESEVDLEQVLLRIVEEARGVLAARYGGLTYFHKNSEVAEFITLGFDHPEGAIPDPMGHGVIGAVTREGGVLHLDDVSTHPLSVGFPEGHPDMKPLLAVPIRSKDSVLGNLYLADDAGVRFDDRSEKTLERFAALAAVAIENAHLHQQVKVLAITEERERIAREMHDSLAQVLGYVNSKAQALSVLLESGKTGDASRQLDQMASAARAAYADVREGILSLRTSLDDDRGFIDTLRDYLQFWENQSGVHAELSVNRTKEGRLTDLAEVQLLRIVQESLSNVRKHAEANRVTISVWDESGFVVTKVADDGQGIAAKARPMFGVPQFGMSTMRERAEAVGGTIKVDSRVNEGTTITIRLPVVAS
jgi:signal transduction histidine kinase